MNAEKILDGIAKTLAVFLFLGAVFSMGACVNENMIGPDEERNGLEIKVVEHAEDITFYARDFGGADSLGWSFTAIDNYYESSVTRGPSIALAWPLGPDESPPIVFSVWNFKGDSIGVRWPSSGW